MLKMITRHFNNLPVSGNLLSNLDNLKNTLNIKPTSFLTYRKKN